MQKKHLYKSIYIIQIYLWWKLLQTGMEGNISNMIKPYNKKKVLVNDDYWNLCARKNLRVPSITKIGAFL